MAKRRLPKIAFDFIEGGLEDERGLERNTSAFHKHQLLPRYLVDVSKRDQSQTIFGQKFASPFGISPTGGAGLFRRGADLMLAEAAADANIPYIMSGASNDSIEIGRPGRAEQCLVPALRGARRGDLRGSDPPGRRLRARRAGADRRRAGAVEARAQHPQRLRQYPRQLAERGAEPASRRMLAEAMTHPGWVVEYIRHGGTPKLENWLPYAGAERDAPRTRSSSTARRCRRTPRPGRISKNTAGCSRATWSSRASWTRATRSAPPRSAATGSSCRTTAARQLDQAPASLDVLPAVKAAVGDRMTVMLDSGVRRGADILIALCLGAQFVFFGRPTLYGAVAGGLPGVKKAVDIFRTEIDTVMAPDRLPEPRPARPRLPVAGGLAAQPAGRRLISFSGAVEPVG